MNTEISAASIFVLFPENL